MDFTSKNGRWAVKAFNSHSYVGWLFTVAVPLCFLSWNQRFGGEFWTRKNDKSRYFWRPRRKEWKKER